jgi:ABC-2 type transport system ATP-binding protein
MITATELTKGYGATPVVRDVSFECEPGTITGFLGPNGSGKSTTLRMITGLTRPDHGHSTVAGHPFAELPNPSRVVGTLLDPTAMHAGRSGRATLRIAAQLADVPARRVDELLELVGLSGAAADRRVGNYSLGMRQRLGLAQSLIGDPAVLILDEPANGLDPEGIAWMRGLLRDFADRGGTVLLSSHLLSEVQATVDHLVVIAGGRVAASGPLATLLGATGLLVRSPDAHRLAAALRAADISLTNHGDGSMTVDTATAVTAETVARIALAQQVLITELRPSDSGGLEDLFFSLTSDPAAAGPDNSEGRAA